CLAQLKTLPLQRAKAPATMSLRRLEVTQSEAFCGTAWRSLLQPLRAGGVHLQELCLGHLLIAGDGTFWSCLCPVASKLLMLQLPDLIVCNPGGSPLAFADGASVALPLLRVLRLPRAMLVECCSRSLVAEAVSSQTACWEALARQFCRLPDLREVDISGAWRPIDPAQIRILPDDQDDGPSARSGSSQAGKT
ncbi:Ctss, partial [Symbiodinium pilosum]